GLLDRLLGDLVEQDTVDLAVNLADLVGKMPCDSLALTIGVGGEVDILFVLGGGADSFDNLRLAGDHLVIGLETAFDIDPQLALGQVHHMAHRWSDLEVSTQVPLYRFRLSR